MKLKQKTMIKYEKNYDSLNKFLQSVQNLFIFYKSESIKLSG